ncbi:hypothetical protein D0T51_10225 [Parabacteroides sp. 52]|uniref:BF3164 family lipoprotein n=1 Tax=unclassified Parabacteroides TaxID=2649774 RepID=UPI0013D34A3B|nr:MULTISPECIES: BF3164 family lipoprotein [unclassified Parabacteroides]MDH6534689.1 hypothetical protein [Parabacteroides sp. PM5-20]NDV56101.1 hypothetical protein [Parabacteroides sp. 52]
MKKSIFILFVVFFMIECSTKKESPYEFSDVEVISFEEIDFPATLGVTLQLVKYDNHLLINDFHGDSLVSVFNLKKNEIDRKIISKGKGPNELISPLDIQVSGDNLYILSRPIFSLNHIDLDFIKKETAIPLQKDFQLPPKSDRFIALDNSLFIFSGLWEKRYVYLDLNKPDELREFGEYPDYWSEEKDVSNEVKAMFHQCQFIKHPTKNIFASCSGYVFEIYTYDSGKKTLPNLLFKKQLGSYSYSYTEDGILTANAHTDSDPMAIDLACSDTYIYIITQSADNRKKRDIMVLDWEGNPIKLLKSDKCIVCLTVDEESGKGYCVIEDPEDTLVSFALRNQ